MQWRQRQEIGFGMRIDQVSPGLKSQPGCSTKCSHAKSALQPPKPNTLWVNGQRCFVQDAKNHSIKPANRLPTHKHLPEIIFSQIPRSTKAIQGDITKSIPQNWYHFALVMSSKDPRQLWWTAQSRWSTECSCATALWCPVLLWAAPLPLHTWATSGTHPRTDHSIKNSRKIKSLQATEILASPRKT